MRNPWSKPNQNGHKLPKTAILKKNVRFQKLQNQNVFEDIRATNFFTDEIFSYYHLNDLYIHGM